jgi:hypothetical protein
MKTTNKVATLAATLITIGSLAGVANAAIVTYSDPTLFTSGATELLSTYGFENFLTDESFNDAAVDAGDFSISILGVGDSSFGNNIVDTPPVLTITSIDGSTGLNVFTELGNSFLITFDSPIFSFGADFAAFNDGGNRTQIFIDGQSVTTPDSPSFFGIISDQSFTTVEFRGNNNDLFGVDNIHYSAVPEPSSALLLGLGAIGFVIRRRRTN